MTDRPPSIVIVHGHDLGRHMGPYGRGVSTPAVDRFARGALTFDRAFSPAPQCSPSRASLITGKYPTKSGMMGLAHLDWKLSDHRDPLPHLLRELGYATLLVGEQHEASRGELLGYDRCIGTSWPQVAREVAPAFARALDERDAHRPFFASVGFFEAHRPFDHPGYVDDDPETVTLPPYLPDTPEVRADVAAFHGRVRGFDDGVAFPRAKGTLYDAGIETGLVIRWPGVTHPGTRADALVQNLDLFPTLLRAAGGTPDAAVDGVDLTPLLRGETAKVRDHIFAQLHWHDAYVPMRAIRTDTHKLILDFSGRDALYLPADVEASASGRALRATAQGSPARVALHDLVRDPLETRNVAHDDAYREVVVDLRARLLDWMRAAGDPLIGQEVTS